MPPPYCISRPVLFFLELLVYSFFQPGYVVYQPPCGSLDAVTLCKPASKAVRSRMQHTLLATRPTPHGTSRLVQAMSAWSVQIRRAPSRHCGDARVYDHTTTAMNGMSTPPVDVTLKILTTPNYHPRVVGGYPSRTK